MSLRDFKLLTFDVVGTLIDFEKGVMDYLRRASGKTPAELSDAAIYKVYLVGRERNYLRSSQVFRDVYRHIAAELGFPNDDAHAEGFQTAVLQWPAFPDSAEALRRLRRHYRLVAMTNADRVALSCYAHTLGDPFDDTVCFDDTGVAKPDPTFFAYNRGRQSAFGYKHRDNLHVAQSQHHDIGIARQLGYKTCWIERRQGQEGWGGTPEPKVVTKPDYHFATLAQLADAVDAAFDTPTRDR
ncbi:HAD-IA family hydrolase [Lichenifustis flavocetrariae]|uniref:HAD-IA family hydrolase n=1 Tax=Lichenifustis flavocetrariae TaxID=2949735 RepID=A0AA41Z1U6_9HYPH|nr:HAD-IA family hydrolase [Lichenifustis flavocetrariae]MCW6512681.1 HAD-IA family hydrolase [Lichenifustis flavocetrariae]